MKRFYRFVTVEDAGGNGFHIALDGKPVRTPAGRSLCAPNKNVAALVQKEWADVADNIVPADMYMTQILNTSIDTVAGARRDTLEHVMAYLDTDLLCYIADGPPDTAAAQDAAWAPLRERFEKDMGHKLVTTTGLAAIRQPDTLHRALRTRLEGLSDLRLTLVTDAADQCTSVILAVLMVCCRLDAETARNACRVEEDHNARKGGLEADYGHDRETARQDAGLRAGLKAVELMVAAL